MTVKCPVCAGSNIKGGSSIYRCGSCSHAFTSIPEGKEEIYDSDYFSKTHKNYFSIPDLSLFNFIRGHVSKLLNGEPIKLLDCGCGKGSFLMYMAAKTSAAELYGIDLIANQEHPRIRFIKGDFFAQRFETNFNVICSIETVEHMSEPRLFIQKIKEVLEPSGFLFLSTSNCGGMLYKTAQLLDKIGMSKPFYRLYSFHHINHYTNRSLKKLMKINGLDVVSLKNYNPPLQSIDIPEDNLFIEKIYRFFIFLIFLLSGIFNSGMRQVIVCRMV